MYLLSAVDHQTGYGLSQSRVDEKTKEHKAALPSLKEMVLHGRVVVGDAMFCQRDLCPQIVEAKGDYPIAVKDNQPVRLREISLEFRTAASVVKEIHGRVKGTEEILEQPLRRPPPRPLFLRPQRRRQARIAIRLTLSCPTPTPCSC